MSGAPLYWVANFENDPFPGIDSSNAPIQDKILNSPEEVCKFIAAAVETTQFCPESAYDELRRAADSTEDVTVANEIDLTEPFKMVPMPGSMFDGHPVNPRVVIRPVFEEDVAKIADEAEAYLQESLG